MLQSTAPPPKNAASVLPMDTIDQIYHYLPETWDRPKETLEMLRPETREHKKRYPETRWRFSTVCKHFRAVALPYLLKICVKVNRGRVKHALAVLKPETRAMIR